MEVQGFTSQELVSGAQGPWGVLGSGVWVLGSGVWAVEWQHPCPWPQGHLPAGRELGGSCLAPLLVVLWLYNRLLECYNCSFCWSSRVCIENTRRWEGDREGGPPPPPHHLIPWGGGCTTTTRGLLSSNLHFLMNLQGTKEHCNCLASCIYSFAFYTMNPGYEVP